MNSQKQRRIIKIRIRIRIRARICLAYLLHQERWQTREARWWEEEVLKLLTIAYNVFLQYSHVSRRVVYSCLPVLFS